MPLDDAQITEADVIRNISYVAMKDGTRIAYISYHLKSGPAPTVFLYTPYTASAAAFEIAKPFLEGGYAFVGANFPATGCSEGILEYWFDRKEGIYGAEIVEWIAQQLWSDGNVGMIGNSSAGTVQFWVAAERPPHLRAIVASGVEDGYEDCFAVGGMFQLGLATWALDSEFVSQAAGAEWRISAGDTECAVIRGSGKQVVKRSFFDEVRKHPLKDEWWDSVYLARDEVVGQVSVPTMLIASWQDEAGGAVRESARLFTQLLTNVKHKKLLLMNGDHAIAGPGPKAYSIVDSERMRFLDRWVKGVENGIEQELPVTVFWDVRELEGFAKKSAAGWTTMHEDWPEPTIERRSFYLTADAALSPDQPVASPAEGVRAYLYPTGSELVGSNQQFAIPPYSPGVLNYRTAPAGSDMVLLGNPEITLFLSIDHGDDADLELTLKDVDPDGNVLYLQGGLLRTSLRAIDHTRTYADEVVHSFRKSEKLVPGEIYEIKMSLLNPIAHAVRQGHRLELTIGATNPIPHSIYSCIPAGSPSINRIHHSTTYPSKMMLPVVPGAAARAQAPQPGLQRNQPCRKGPEFVLGGLQIP
ncbi:CocE/NonD family hydrolase [Mesorhizobium sp. M1121]|uniref:CocE/NonD family hydrolase n=1 Tax=Mesorhizobium sp. M1121 TaxID=2957058 RepID=UPI00333D9CF5